jgi:catechol 2,3-dioxygenase-like lactoylglutathione lyase family enzyme
MKLRTGEPWMPSKDYARTLKGQTVGLIVRDIGKSIHFQQEVLKTKVVYSDVDFAVIQGYGSEWMLHADHTYQGHPLENVFAKAPQRGAGVELRLHGCDPDAAAAAARQSGYKVLSEATDKPYELREAHLVDADGYVWVPDVPAKTPITKEN